MIWGMGILPRTDLAETNNIAEEMPDKVKELSAIYYGRAKSFPPPFNRGRDKWEEIRPPQRPAFQHPEPIKPPSGRNIFYRLSAGIQISYSWPFKGISIFLNPSFISLAAYFFCVS